MTEETLFHEALAKPLPERAAFLEQACIGQPQLRAAVEELLAAHEASGNLLDKPPRQAQTVDAGPGQQGHEATGDFSRDSDEVEVATADYRPSIKPGVVISGRYTLVEKIGEGGMGEVWVAKQTEPVKRKVALKLIKTGMDSKAVLARFEQERQALALMEHPNIARVLDGGMTPTGQPFFVMELVNGLPLNKYCDDARLTPKDRLELFIPICQAVQHAHQKGIVHRDLKPANILVTLYDGKPVPKVIDFGVAKATGGKLTDESMLTQFGAVVGTLEYMSPEQAGFSAIDVDTRADIYSLGVILYELLTGLRPIDAKRLRKGALTEMIRIIQEEEPSKPSTRLSTDASLPSLAASRQMEPKKLMALLRGELDWVVMKCLEKQRDRRYETVNALSRDIQRYLADEPVEARPPSMGYRFQKLLQRNRVAVLAVGAVAASLLLGTGIATWQAIRATNAEAEERSAKQDALNAEAEERKAKKNAVKLAEDNAKLAKDESDAKNQAKKLADSNAKLAINERDAKNQAIEATKEKEKQLLRTKAILFTSQMERVAQIREKDPITTLDLLHDTEACPVDMRDLAWNFAEQACKRHLVTSFPVPPGLGKMQALSPDGKWVANANSKVNSKTKEYSGKVTLIDVSSRKIHTELPEFSDSVELLAFSPDGSKLAIVADGALPRQFPHPLTKEIEPVSIVPGKVQIWDVAQAKKITTLEGHVDRVTALAFNPDGTQLATGSLDSTARIWNLETGKEKQVLKGHGKAVAAVAFHPDGKRFATGGLDNTIKFWDLEKSEPLATWTPAPNPSPVLASTRKSMVPYVGANSLLQSKHDCVIALDFSLDGKSLLSANSNWLIEVRDVASGQVRSTLREFENPIRWVRFHRDGKSVVLNGGPSVISSWVYQIDVTTGQVVFVYKLPLPASITSEYAKESSLLATTYDGHLDIFDLDAPLERAKFVTAEKVEGVKSVTAFSRSGDILATAFGAKIVLWNVRTGKLRNTLVGHQNTVRSLAVSPDGRTLASSAIQQGSTPLPKANTDNLLLWDITTGESLGTIPTGPTSILSVAFSPDGLSLAALHYQTKGGLQRDLILSIWDVKSRKLQFTLETSDTGSIPTLNDRITNPTVAFHPVDATLVSISGRSLCIWNLKTRKLQRQILVGSVAALSGNTLFNSLAISPDGKLIVTSNRLTPASSEINVWNPNTGELVKKVRNTWAETIGFSHDSKTLVTTSSNSVTFWDVLTMQKRASFSAHNSPGMVSLAISPDSQTLATVVIPSTSNVLSEETRAPAEIKLWDVSRSPNVLTFPSAIGTPSKLKFMPDSKTLIETHMGAMRIWDLKTGSLRSNIDTTTIPPLSLLSPDGRYLAGTDVVGTEHDKRTAGMIIRGFGTRIGPYSKSAGSYQALLNLWDMHTNTLRQIEIGKGVVRDSTFSPDGKNIAIIHDTSIGDDKVQELGNAIEMWNVAESRAVALFPFPDTSLSSPVFSPDGNTLVLTARDLKLPQNLKEPSVTSKNVRILLVDANTGKVLQSLKDGGDEKWIRSCKFSKDGNLLAVRQVLKYHESGKELEKGPETVWDWRSGKQMKENNLDVFEEANPNISPDGRYELKFLPNGVEVIDRTVTPPAVVNQRKKL